MKIQVIFKLEFFIPPPNTVSGIMVHCHHGSIQQLLGNQLLLGADETTHVLIIAGSLSIFSKNKGIAWQDNPMKPENNKRTFILPPHTMTSFSIAYIYIWSFYTFWTLTWDFQICVLWFIVVLSDRASGSCSPVKDLSGRGEAELQHLRVWSEPEEKPKNLQRGLRDN